MELETDIERVSGGHYLLVLHDGRVSARHPCRWLFGSQLQLIGEPFAIGTHCTKRVVPHSIQTHQQRHGGVETVDDDTASLLSVDARPHSEEIPDDSDRPIERSHDSPIVAQVSLPTEN